MMMTDSTKISLANRGQKISEPHNITITKMQDAQLSETLPEFDILPKKKKKPSRHSILAEIADLERMWKAEMAQTSTEGFKSKKAKRKRSKEILAKM